MHRTSLRHRTTLALLTGLVALGAACSGGEQPGGSPTASVAQPGTAQPRPGGTIHEVEMVTDTDGNYFGPADLTVKQGDVIRWKLKSGVHNARFVTDSSPGVANLPETSGMLQAPGQTYDVLVETAPGRYFYHCDPHALLGMVGHLTVVAP